MGKTSSLKTILEQIKLLQKDKKIRLVITMAAVLLSAFIQAWAIQVFVRPAEIISGGFSGAAMLIERVGSLKGLTIPMQVTMILLNIPVALMCCRGISVRFTVVSLLQVVFGSIFLQIFSFQPIFTDEILNVIFGGVIYGTSIVIALRGNASTGGTDFIALYVSNKTGKSIWSYVFFGNALMYCVYGVIFGWKFAGYSIIFQFASTQMIHMLHTAYKKETLFIVTDRPDDVYKEIYEVTNHSATEFAATGCYSNKQRKMLYSVVSSSEAKVLVSRVQKADPEAFINVIKTDFLEGHFYQKVDY